MELQGTITKIGTTEERPYQDKVFKTRKFRLKTNEQYPQVYEIEMNQDKVGVLDNYKVGDNILAYINLRGREWAKEGKEGVFMSIQAWKLEKQTESTHAEAAMQGNDNSSLPF